MLIITVKFFATIRLATGVSEMKISSDTSLTIKKLIEICSDKLKKNLSEEILSDSATKIKEGTIILVNGKNILHSDNLGTKVQHNDTVAIFPPAGGG